MPAFRANATNGSAGVAGCFVSATFSGCRKSRCGVHGGTPQVESSVFGAGIGAVVVAIAFGGVFAVGVVQVFCHPSLVADFDGLVNLSVAGVDHFAVGNFGVQVLPVCFCQRTGGRGCRAAGDFVARVGKNCLGTGRWDVAG